MEKKLFESKPVSIEIANAEIKKFKDLKEPFTNAICEMAKAFHADQEMITFYSSEFNAFIFKRESVLRFFDTSKQQGEKKEEATHLMVILGAHVPEKDSAFKLGSPTVIVTGVVPFNNDEQESGKQQTEKPGNGQKFRTLSITDPAEEYPDQGIVSNLSTLHELGGEPVMIFTIE